MTRYAASTGSALKSPTTIVPPGAGRSSSQATSRASLLLPCGLVRRHVMEVRHDHRQLCASRDRHQDAECRPLPAEVEPFSGAGDGEGSLDEHAVAILGPAGIPAAGLVATRAGGAEQPVLLHGEDALLDAQEVGLQGCHVGEEQREPFRPAVGDVPDVQRGDVEVRHQASPAGVASGTGSRIVNVAPGPSPLRLRAEPSAVAFHDVAGDRQAQAGAAAGRPRPVRLVEPLEDPGQVRGRDPGSVVDDRRLHVPRRSIGPSRSRSNRAG